MVILTSITDTKGEPLDGVEAKDYDLAPADILVLQDRAKNYSVTVRLRPKGAEALPDAATLVGKKVNVSWTDENGHETIAIFGRPEINEEEKCIVVWGLTLKGAFQFEFYGVVEFHGLTATGKIGGYKDGNEKGMYAYLQVAQAKTLPEIIAAASGNEVDPETIKVPSLVEEDKQTAVSFYLKYGAGQDNAKDFILQVEIKFKINDTPLDLTLAYYHYSTESKDPKAKGRSGSGFRGILKVDEHRFSLVFSKDDGGKSFLATYLYDGRASFDLSGIARKWLNNPNIPSISLALAQPTAFFIYKKEKASGKNNFLFGIGAKKIMLEMKGLPVAGGAIPEESFGVEDLLLIIANHDFDRGLVRALDAEYFDKIKLPPALKKFNFSATIKAGKHKITFSTGQKELPEKQAGASSSTSTKPVMVQQEPEVSNVPATSASSTKWVDVKKKLGPVELYRVGFGFVDGKIILLLDASFKLAALGVQFRGLGLGLTPQLPPKVTDFYLSGLGISFKKDPIEISGAFLRTTEAVEVNTINENNEVVRVTKEVNVYTGGAILKLIKFKISGIGSYAKVETVVKKDGKNVIDSYTSLFIYAVYDGPIGGPAFFFVTGIAAGFGMNRKVNAPAIDEVQDFPLVSLALNPGPSSKQKDLMQILETLQTPSPKTGKLPIEISQGDYWLAVGIKFTSFQIIESFLLLIISFGNRLRFDILGLSVLQVPNFGDFALIYVELALKISFGTDSDVITVEARITENSYLFSKDARLTGGFALYIWVSGPREGDFVITLGGYHPKFKKPPHYPDVDRLGLNWQVIPKTLSMKGEMYFALTPSAIMAGGRWEVLFTTSVVRAWLIIWADILIQWAPLFYDLSAGVLIGVEVNLGLVHLRIEIGAQLHIYGPPFAGEMVVHLWIISFTITFGDHSQREVPALPWGEFRKSFLPPLKEKKARSGTDEQEGTSTRSLESEEAPKVPIKTAPLTVVISDGIIEEHKNEAGEVTYTLVNPHKLMITIDSAIPVKHLFFNGDDEVGGNTPLKISAAAKEEDKKDEEKEKEENSAITYGERNQNLGLFPMKQMLNSRLHVAIKKGNSAVPIEKTGIGKSFPKALWGTDYPVAGKGKKKSMSIADMNPADGEEFKSAVIRNVLSGLELNPRVEGIPAGTPGFDLNGTYTAIIRELTWSYERVLLGPDNESYQESIAVIIKNSLTDATVKEHRKKLLSLNAKIGGLAQEKSTNNTTENEDDDQAEKPDPDLLADWLDHLSAVPVIVPVGGMPQYAIKGKA